MADPYPTLWRCGGVVRFLLALPTLAAAQTFTHQEQVINSGRPTLDNPSTSIAGKIALEEHVGSSTFPGIYTTPFVNHTNKVNFNLPIYLSDIPGRINNIDTRVANMDAANISTSVVLFGSPGIQGVFNTTYATELATLVNDEIASVYKFGNYSSRFEFWCSNALQDPPSAAQELERCVKKLLGRRGELH